MKLLDEYRELLSEIDEWFIRCQEHYPGEIACARGCSECCRGLFDITLIDAALLNMGFDTLAEDVKNIVMTRVEERLIFIRTIWPEFNHPFTINHRPEEEREELMASDNHTKCVLLDDDGKCLLYEYRPMTCRLHGLPLIDVSGEIMESEWCTKNFPLNDPLQLKSLAGEFNRLFQREAALGRDFTKELLGKAVNELDSFIPVALLIDFKGFNWKRWFAGYLIKT
jgi:Fe-S-cluster containining protein